MRHTTFFTAALLVGALVFSPAAMAFSDEESKEMFTKLVHSYYESDAQTFYKICSRFERPLFEKLKDVRVWMDDRLAEKMTFLKVQGVIVMGKAKIVSERLGRIMFRFDGTRENPSRIIVVTAWVNRVIEFDDSVPPERRKVDQEAILKIYATLVDEKLVTFKSDEIDFGYRFSAKGEKPTSPNFQ
ncbi:hypothetical protein MNBD_NITROSPINAE02-1157 [hydrothermal vent metagenome]|uniref:Uncharacterized protein n=1 Tax=hydrothermal vent metagenome TaxID=652676 RepID=A0A3B1CL33_9ZZZZ